jgi:hypothetical protein
MRVPTALRKLALAGLASCALAGAANGQGYCNRSAQVPSSGAGTIKPIADPSVGTARIYVCGFTLAATASATAQLVGGTGATCTGSPQNLTGAMSMAAGTTIIDSSWVARGMRTQPGAGLCVVITGTGPVAGVIYYSQQ